MVIPGSGYSGFRPGFKGFRVYSWSIIAHSLINTILTVLPNSFSQRLETSLSDSYSAVSRVTKRLFLAGIAVYIGIMGGYKLYSRLCRKVSFLPDSTINLRNVRNVGRPPNPRV